VLASVATAASLFSAHASSAAYLSVSASPGRALTLRAAPGGRVIARVRHSVFGGRVVVGVVRRSGPWIAVTSELVPNGRVAWVDTRSDVVLAPVRYALRASLSNRRLRLFRDHRLVRTFTVAIGAPTSPTPTGRFSIAEKLDGTRFGAGFGCCILGLTAHQPSPPAGWSRATSYFVAIHGGGGIGAAISAGCLHLDDADLRYLMRTVPLGTPVFISA
jgi:lipoprotein-anchoring transpeptidase ErfK/SrfK